MNTIELSIGHIGLPDMDVQRLKAVMAMAITNSSLKAHWCLRDAAKAELVIFSPDSAAARRMLAERKPSDRRVYAALVGEADRIEDQCERLGWPIRLEGLLPLLKRVERRQPKPDAGSPSRAGDAPISENHLIRWASLLRDVSDVRDGMAWRIEGASRQPIFIVPEEKKFYFRGPLTNLRNMDANIRLDFAPIPIEETPDSDVAKPIQMLEWLVGLRAGPLGLFPWLDANDSYQLKKFPEFQILLHSPSHRRIAATLVRPIAGVAAIKQVSREDASVVAGFINAASLCGYLNIGASSGHRRRTGMVRRGPRRALFRSFRKALGIEVADV